jgi:Rrf2 family protein
MRISARCDYACKALLELALSWEDSEPLTIQAISRKQKIPLRYLVQILIQLKRMGLVESLRGKQGGYRLARPPVKISLGELIREIDGPLLPVANSAVKNNSVFGKVWKEVENAMAGVVDQITFEDIANRTRGIKGAIVYQI